MKWTDLEVIDYARIIAKRFRLEANDDCEEDQKLLLLLLHLSDIKACLVRDGEITLREESNV
jgi:hypothetical protein